MSKVYKVKLHNPNIGNVKYTDEEGYYQALSWGTVRGKEPDKFALLDSEDDYGVLEIGTFVEKVDIFDIK